MNIIALKGNAAYLKKIIMHENDALFEYNKIHLVTIVPMSPFTPKSTSKFYAH